MYFFTNKLIKVYFLVICLFNSSIVLSQPSFIPSDISNLRLWLKSDTGIVFSGINIQRWEDQSGLGNDAVQDSVSLQPVYVSSIINGYGGARFDNDNDGMQTTFNCSVDSFSIFVLYSYESSLSSYRRAIQGGSNNWLLGPYQGSYRIFAGGFAFGPSIDSGKFVIQSAFQRASILYNYVNGVQYGNISNPSYPGTICLGASGVSIFQPLEGVIVEVIAYNTFLSDSLRLLVDKYLSDKYAPPVNLGADKKYGFCDTLLDAGSRFQSFAWSTGATTQTIHVNQSGTYWVNVTNIFGFVSSDTINVVYPSVSSPLPKTNTICYGDSLIWNTQLDKKEYKFVWNTNPLDTDSVFVIKQAGQYFVKVTDTLGCFRYSDTISVSVDNFPQIPRLGNDTSICSGASVALVSGAAQVTSYLWSTGETTSSIAITSTDTFSLTVHDAMGCSATDSIKVSVKGIKPNAGFIAGAVCFGNTMTFTDTTSAVPLPDAISVWHWNFGDGGNSSVQNPTHTYTAMGTFTTTFTVSTDSGCTATFQRKDTVNPKPTAIFNVQQSACLGDAVTFYDLSNGNPVLWKWDFGDGNSSTLSLSGTSHTYTAAGTYSIQLVVFTNLGCSDTAFKSVTVYNNPTAVFSADTVCLGNQTSFQANSSDVITNWVWNFGDSNNSTVQNTQHTYSNAGTYNAVLTVTSDHNCTSNIYGNVDVYFSPVPDFHGDSVCVNTPLQFTDASFVNGDSITAWNWQFDSADSSMQQNPVITFTTSGTYSVTLQVTSSKGCSASIQKNVFIAPLPAATFSFSPQYGPLPLAVNFDNQTPAGSTYTWSFGDGSPADTSSSPSHSYQHAGTYTITLIAENQFGCMDTTFQTFTIDEPVLDLAVNAIGIIQQPGIVQVYAVLKNTGNTDVHSALLSAYLDDGTPVLETCTDTIKPTYGTSYLFNSSFEILADRQNSIACIDIVKVNGRADDNLSNNHSCTAIANDFILLNPFPNPTNGDIYFLFIVPEAGTVNAKIYDARGRAVESFQQNAGRGLNQIMYSTIKLEKGTYYFKLFYQDKTAAKVFLKK